MSNRQYVRQSPGAALLPVCNLPNTLKEAGNKPVKKLTHVEIMLLFHVLIVGSFVGIHCSTIVVPHAVAELIRSRLCQNFSTRLNSYGSVHTLILCIKKEPNLSDATVVAAAAFRPAD